MLGTSNQSVPEMAIGLFHEKSDSSGWLRGTPMTKKRKPPWLGIRSDQGWSMKLMFLMANWGKLKPVGSVGSPWFSHCMSKSPVRDFDCFCVCCCFQHVRFTKLPSRFRFQPKQISTPDGWISLACSELDSAGNGKSIGNHFDSVWWF